MNVGLALGSNSGDRLLNLQRARDFLLELSAGRRRLQSPIYETAPVDCPPGSQSFYNAVVEIDFAGEPEELFAHTRAYENAQGRLAERAAGVNAPRTIDIDILYFGDRILTEPDLVIPHPRLRHRRFELVPLANIRPDLILAGTGNTISVLLQQLPPADQGVNLVCRDW